MLEGVHTALITPFAGGRLDAGRLPGLVDRQIEGGVSGLVPAGTTGESPTLHPREHLELIRQVVQAAGGRVPVIAGTGANCTREAVELTAEAQRAGADASLQVAPYYNKPSQEGLYRHFREIARATSLPLVLYSVPGRCAVSIEVPTLARLHRECPSIVGIKEASGQVDRVSRIREELGSGFLILSGDDATALPFLAAGAAGVVSVASNLLPGEVSGMVRRFLRDGDPQGALKEHQRLFGLFQDLFLETNPVPIKTAMAACGLIEPEIRLPLAAMEASRQERLLGTLRRLSLPVSEERARLEAIPGSPQ